MGINPLKAFPKIRHGGRPFRCTFFIKKAKAVISSNNTVKAAQSESELPQLNDHFPRIESVTFSTVFANANPQQGFLFVILRTFTAPCLFVIGLRDDFPVF